MEKYVVEEEEEEELVSKPIHANENRSMVIINGVPPTSTYNYDSCYNYSYNTHNWDHNCDLRECPPPHKKHFCINGSDSHYPNTVNIYKVPNLNNKHNQTAFFPYHFRL